MKINKNIHKAFGKDENGFVAFPRKISGIQISRILIGEESGCSRCFPHGYETYNSSVSKFSRSWKEYRKRKWKTK